MVSKEVYLFVYPAASLSISELFSGPYLLNIPIFQRSYCWGQEQAEQLLDDVMQAAGIGTGGEPQRSYFFGAVVLMDAPGVETTKLTPKMSERDFGVIDGQQRLITLMTLFAVLRDLETDAKKPVSKHVTAMLIAAKRFFRGERFRLQLLTRERRVFEDNILLPGSTLAQTPTGYPSLAEATLLDVRDYYCSALSELSGPTRRSLAEYLANHCFVTAIVGNDIDRSHHMFEVLNERGKKLQRNDTLKSDVLGRMGESDARWAAELWEGISFALGDDFEPFFGHLRTIYGHGRLQIVTGVRTVIREAGGPERFFKDVFLPLANAYSLVRRSGEGTLPPDMVRNLTYLNRLADADWAPAAILALKDWVVDPERAAFLLREIERLAMLARLLCEGTGKRVRRFADLVKLIRSGEPIDGTHPALQASREEVRSAAFHLKDFHKRSPKACNLLLMRLGDEIAGAMTNFDPELYTVEHVLPQRPAATSSWQQGFASAEERSQMVESLGNLVLITQKENDKARNASWEEKKDIYARGAAKGQLLPITSDVITEKEWRRVQIEARERRLFSLIDKLWRLDISAQRPARRGAKATEESEPAVFEPVTTS